MVSSIDSIKSELAIRTLECLEVVDFIYEVGNSKRVIAKVKDNIDSDQLIKAGQSINLKYIIYQVSDLRNYEFSIVRWITSTGETSASNSESLSNSFSFKRSYTISAMGMLIDKIMT